MTHVVGLGPPFWRFWTAAAAANPADGVRTGAFPLLAVALGGSPFEIATVFAAQQGAWLLFSLAAGSAADRYVAIRVVALADGARIAVLAILLVLAVLGRATMPLLAVAAFVVGTAEVFRDTSATSVVPQLVDDPQLERANARLVSAEIVGNEFAGPLVGSAVLAVALVLPVGLDASLLLLAVIMVCSLAGALHAHPGGHTPGWSAGIPWLRAHPHLLAVVLCGAAVMVADSAWWSVLVLVSADDLGLPPAGFGALLAAGAVGGVLGALCAERWAQRLPARFLLPVAAVWTGLPAAGIPATDSPAAVGGLLLVSSASFALWNVAVVTMRQRLVPAAVLGRVTAVYRLAVAAGGTAGALAGGVLAQTTGRFSPFLLGAGLAVVAGTSLAIALRRPT